MIARLVCVCVYLCALLRLSFSFSHSSEQCSCFWCDSAKTTLRINSIEPRHYTNVSGDCASSSKNGKQSECRAFLVYYMQWWQFRYSKLCFSLFSCLFRVSLSCFCEGAAGVAAWLPTLSVAISIDDEAYKDTLVIVSSTSQLNLIKHTHTLPGCNRWPMHLFIVKRKKKIVFSFLLFFFFWSVIHHTKLVKGTKE